MPFPARVGRYEIKSRIGGGGMGTLYLARDTNPTTDRLVALKLLNANLEHGDLRARFSREARSLSALSHPNIVIIHDSGEFQGAPFIVMEYVRGESLAEKIRRQAPMSLGQKVRLMAELCDGLAHAHGAGIIHRDIKPANLMVDQHGRLKILDFGIAREGDGRHAPGAAPLTRLNTSIGTPGYMSPEQIEGVEIDHRADLFSAGTVCYELLAYREAFGGATTRQIEKRVMHDDPPPLTDAVPGLDPRIADIIALAMKKDANDRAQSAGELLDAFQSVRARLAPDEQATRVTPLPSLEGAVSSESRRQRLAEAAYQRALTNQAAGALDFARRSALEALAEDPEHRGARAWLRELGGEGDLAFAAEATELAIGDPSGATQSAVATVVVPAGSRPRKSPAPLPWRPDQRTWLRFAPLAGAVAFTALLLAVAFAYRDRWRPADEVRTERVTSPLQTPQTPEATTTTDDVVVPTTLIAVLEDALGVPVGDAEVTLSPGDLAAPGNGSGQYLFESIRPGPYALTARHRDFRERTVRLEVVAGGVSQSLVLERVGRSNPGPLAGPGGPRRNPYGGDGGGRIASKQATGPGGPDGGVTDPLPRPPPTVATTTIPPTTRSTVLAHDSLDRAIRALNVDGDVERAEILVAEAQRLDPDSKEIAAFAEKLREIRAAERRQRVRDHVLKAQRLFRESGDLDGALREVDSALKILPSDPQAVGLHEEILRVKAIGTKRPPPLVVGLARRWDAAAIDYTEHR